MKRRKKNDKTKRKKQKNGKMLTNPRPSKENMTKYRPNSWLKSVVYATKSVNDVMKNRTIAMLADMPCPIAIPCITNNV